MRKLLAFLIVGSQFFSSCDSEPAPGTTIEPEPTVNAPGKANLNTPENNKECEQGNIDGNKASVNFNWSASSETTSYNLEITNLDTQAVTSKSGITDTAVEAILERGHPYSWTVISKNAGAVSTSSETWKFYLSGDGESNFAPFPAAAEYPSPGATVTPENGKITIQWEEVQDADGDEVTYTLYADVVDGAQTPLAKWKNISATSMEIDVNANTVYYWKVITSDGTNSSTSTTYSFKTTD